MDFPKKQQQCLIPKYLLDYLDEVNELHPDPSDLGGGDNIEAGTGIEITGDETKTISIDDSVVAVKNDIPDVSEFITGNDLSEVLEDYELKSEAFSGSYNDLTDKPTNHVTTDTTQTITGSKTFSGTTTFSGDANSVVFTGRNPIKMKAKGSDASLTTGFTFFDRNDNEKAYVQYNPSQNALYMGKYRSDADFGYLVENLNKNYRIFVPNAITSTGAATLPANTYYIPVTVNGTKADSAGEITIAIPTATSDLTNDSGYITGITSSDVTTALGYTPGTSNFSGDYDDLTNKPTIPTATSDLTNDSGFITSSAIPTNYVTTNTEQTISGIKRFSARTVFNNTALMTDNNFTWANSISGDQLSINADTMISLDTTNNRFCTLGFPHNIDKYDWAYLALGATDGTTDVYADGEGKIDISSLLPTKTSDLTNDSGFITSSDLPTNYVTTDTSQTITANKIFNNPNYIYQITTNASGMEVKSSGYQTTVCPNFVHCYQPLFYSTFYSPSSVSCIPTMASQNYKIKITDYQDSTTHYEYSFVQGKSGEVAVTSEIPTNVSDLTNDSGYITGITSSDVTTALGYTPGTSNFDGAYSSLTGTPDLSIYAQSANLATVATSGSYNDLSNKPTIPTVNDNTITITQDGVTKGSFTLNQSSNQTIALDAGGTTYTAGDGIDITNDVISLDESAKGMTFHKISLVTSYSSEEHLELNMLLKESDQILTVSQLINAVAEMQPVAYDDSVVGVIYGQYYLSSSSSSKSTVLGLGLTGSASSPNLYAISNGSAQTSSPTYGSNAGANIRWINHIDYAIGTEVTASCTDIVIPLGFGIYNDNRVNSYTAGTGIDITNNAISVNTSELSAVALTFTYTDDTTETISLVTSN